ncbi:hypothetical protein DPEC_G00291580 [Dallia pectoralis]|uniref:Uncharacterized protein n=1 Tax=Dallia pectoralis TaxID=75939 RepID=A0ACC2FHS4_DALPE|nr:hypothetical protein DPEC_G00291580 [Dallia pectoralis]
MESGALGMMFLRAGERGGCLAGRHSNDSSLYPSKAPSIPGATRVLIRSLVHQPPLALLRPPLFTHTTETLRGELLLCLTVDS